MTRANGADDGSGVAPFYADESVTLYLGDCRQVLPRLGPVADVCVTDPPYGETALVWDRWPDGWLASVAGALPAATSLWCFGSLRMYFERLAEFEGWRLAQDVIWEKPNGSGYGDGRFLRVHEYAVQWYRGAWSDLRHEVPREEVVTSDKSTRRPASAAAHRRPDRASAYRDDGTRLLRSVQRAPQMRYGIHPTEKPVSLLASLIEHSCPPGGTVLDPFGGSGSTADAARATGRRAVLVEADERYCEHIATRLAQGDLFGASA